VSMKAKVINASFGGPASAVMEEAIKNAKDTLFVVASGNGGWFGVGYDIDSNPVYPASYAFDNIVAVAATDNQDKLGRFSNFGAKSVHLAAPGVNILSAMPSSPTDYMKTYDLPAELAAISGT